jgi:hypothetical protein
MLEEGRRQWSPKRRGQCSRNVGSNGKLPGLSNGPTSLFEPHHERGAALWGVGLLKTSRRQFGDCIVLAATDGNLQLYREDQIE